MAEKDAQFTQAGLKGKQAKEEAAKIADKLKRGVGSAEDLVTDAITKGVFEPLANLYPAAVNIAASIGEFGAGVAGRPVNLGRFPYQTLPTLAQRRAAATPAAPPAPPKEQEAIAAKNKGGTPTEFELPSDFWDETAKNVQSGIPISNKQMAAYIDEKKAKETKEQQPPKEAPKPEAPRRIFRAMVQGDPASDQIFETKEEAEKYLKERGLKGIVAGIRFKGETPEDIAQKEKAYRGALTEEKGRKGALERLYATRKQDAMTRQAQMRSAVAELEAATTPEQKALAKGKIESTRLATIFEQGTRGLPEKQKEKLKGSLLGVVSRRAEREKKRAAEVAQARAESQAQRSKIAGERAIDNQIKFYNQQLGTLRRAYRNARIAGDDRAMFDIGQLIDVWRSGVPDDPRDQREAARGGILQEKFTQLEKERRRREELAKTNPDAAR